MITEFAMTAATLLVLGLILCWLILRSTRTSTQIRALTQDITRLEDLLHAQGTGLTGMGRSMQKLQTQQIALIQQLELLEKADHSALETNVGGGSQLYRQAINLAVDGAQPKELAERFGLSRGEAELIVSFHKLSGQAA